MENQSKKLNVEDIVRLLTLDRQPEPEGLYSIFESLPSENPPAEKKERIVQNLKDSLASKSSFGELLMKYLSEKKKTTSEIAEESGIPSHIVDGLEKDSLLPFTVPVVLMKRLIEGLGIKLDQAIESIELTTEILADTILEDERVFARAGISARRGFEISLAGIESKVVRDRAMILQSNKRYIERLKEL
jgi:hypothetical protein